MEKILRGKTVADKLTEEIKEKVSKLKSEGISPKLVMVRVGDSEDDLSYQRAAINRFIKCDIETEVVELDENVTQEEYINCIKKLNNEKSVNGILCFRPLPKHIDENIVSKEIDIEKDVDCFSPYNLTKIVMGDYDFAPCTPMAVVEILKFYGVELVGKNISVIGRSLVVGKPLSLMLMNENATVTICHSKTIDIPKISKESDVIVSCMGRLKMIDKKYVSEKSIVVDVGINFDEEGNMFGDVDYNSVEDLVQGITPVPGGVGSVTTSILAKNTLRACINQNR